MKRDPLEIELPKFENGLIEFVHGRRWQWAERCCPNKVLNPTVPNDPFRSLIIDAYVKNQYCQLPEHNFPDSVFKRNIKKQKCFGPLIISHPITQLADNQGNDPTLTTFNGCSEMSLLINFMTPAFLNNQV